MNETETLATVDVLVGLGFDPVSDPFPGFVFDFGNFKLHAGEVTDLFGRVVMFSGVLKTPRTIAEVDFRIPPRTSSRERCVAMIVYYLDRAAHGKVFEPSRHVDWLAEGRRSKHLLPWEIERATYHARPLCHVSREWGRLAMKTLGQFLDADNPDVIPDDTPVFFCFQDSVLTIRFNSEVIALAGKGKDWEQNCSISAGQLRQLPKRFRSWQVEVSIWDGKLRIGDHVYSGIKVSQP